MKNKEFARHGYPTLAVFILIVLALTGCIKTGGVGFLPTEVIALELTEENMGEAISTPEEIKREQGDDAGQELVPAETGLFAHLEMPELLVMGEKINLKFILTNESEVPLYLLSWYTPLEGIGGEIFRVTYNGQPVPYEGILVSRADPAADSYVLLYPDESTSAVVDLGGAFDFSKIGEYRIEFLSPRISHLALSEAEMASTMEELGPVEIPSNAVVVELIDLVPGEGQTHIRTSKEAEGMIEAYLRDQGLDLGIEPIIPLEELHIEGLWDALGGQVFRVREGNFQKESFLLRGSDVIQLGAVLGGQGLTSLVLTDLDQDGQLELLYAYSSGSDDPKSRIGMYAPAYDENSPLDADLSYLGHWRVYSEGGSQVGVQVVEGESKTKTLRYLDTIGQLSIEVHNGDVRLVLHVLPGLPDEVQGRIIND